MLLPKQLLLIILLGRGRISVCSFLQEYSLNETVYPLTQIAVYSETGDIFVGGRNILAQLSSDLTLKSKVSMGPVLDNINCLPVDESCTRTQRDNDIKVLEIDYTKKQLLVCGSVYQGLCQLHSLKNITVYQQVQNESRNNLLNFVSGKKSVVAFFDRSSSSSILYVAQQYDGRPLPLSPRVLSTRKILQNGNGFYIQLWNNDGGIFSALDVKNPYKSSYNIEYVYGFEYDNYTFFVTVQQTDLSNEELTTKIVRICQEDVTYHTYMDSTLSCKKGGNLYNMAMAAHYSVSDGDHVLYVSAARSGVSTTELDPSGGSVVCNFSMQTIQTHFEEVILNCEGMGSPGRQPQWVHGTKNIPCYAELVSLTFMSTCESVFHICIICEGAYTSTLKIQGFSYVYQRIQGVVGGTGIYEKTNTNQVMN